MLSKILTYLKSLPQENRRLLRTFYYHGVRHYSDGMGNICTDQNDDTLVGLLFRAIGFEPTDYVGHDIWTNFLNSEFFIADMVRRPTWTEQYNSQGHCIDCRMVPLSGTRSTGFPIYDFSEVLAYFEISGSELATLQREVDELLTTSDSPLSGEEQRFNFLVQFIENKISPKKKQK